MRWCARSTFVRSMTSLYERRVSPSTPSLSSQSLLPVSPPSLSSQSLLPVSPPRLSSSSLLLVSSSTRSSTPLFRFSSREEEGHRRRHGRHATVRRDHLDVDPPRGVSRRDALGVRVEREFFQPERGVGERAVLVPRRRGPGGDARRPETTVQPLRRRSPRQTQPNERPSVRPPAVDIRRGGFGRVDGLKPRDVRDAAATPVTVTRRGAERAHRRRARAPAATHSPRPVPVFFTRVAIPGRRVVPSRDDFARHDRRRDGARRDRSTREDARGASIVIVAAAHEVRPVHVRLTSGPQLAETRQRALAGWIWNCAATSARPTFSMATPTATNPTPSIANVDGDAHFADRIVAVSGDAPRTIHDIWGLVHCSKLPTAHAGRDRRVSPRRGTVRISRRPPRFRRGRRDARVLSSRVERLEKRRVRVDRFRRPRDVRGAGVRGDTRRVRSRAPPTRG